jgi:sensor histidine kinase YesM
MSLGTKHYSRQAVSILMDRFFTNLVLSDDLGSRIGRHTLFWVIAWAFQGFIYGFFFVNDDPTYLTFAISFAESLMYLPQHMFLSYSIIYFVLPRYIFKGRYWTGLGLIFGLIVIAALFSPVILYYVIVPFREMLGIPRYFKGIFYSFMGGLRGSMTVAGFAVAIKLVKHWYLKKSENEQLERAKLRAELELLKSQLHPHFMFNTLNSIYAMALKNSPQTADAIMQLSNLMRYMIAESSCPSISLASEVQILKNYMHLEKSRIGDRLDQSLRVDGNLDNKKIAPLLLLPFLENSYKHGVYDSPDPAWLTLDIAVKEDEMRFRLVNGRNTCSPAPNSGIGLQNVKKRLTMLYPGSHDLRISEDNDTYVVSLTLMLKGISIPA